MSTGGSTGRSSATLHRPRARGRRRPTSTEAIGQRNECGHAAHLAVQRPHIRLDPWMGPPGFPSAEGGLGRGTMPIGEICFRVSCGNMRLFCTFGTVFAFVAKNEHTRHIFCAHQVLRCSSGFLAAHFPSPASVGRIFLLSFWNFPSKF